MAGFKFLKKLTDDHLYQRSLVELLDKKLASMEAARSHKLVHISTVTDADHGFCPRQFALLDVLEKKLPAKFINAATRVAFDNGTALHDLCRDKWLRDEVVGLWKCKYCKEARHFSKLPVLTKGADCTHEWVYHEESFVDPSTKITGSIDFFVDLGNKKLTVVECKSIDKDQFAALAGPLAKHRIRTQMYLTLIERTASEVVKDQIDLTHGRILYISKGFGKKSEEHGKVLPFREFSVQRNDDAVEKYFELGQQVANFRKGGPLPGLTCTSRTDKRASACVVCMECFSGKYPPKVKL